MTRTATILSLAATALVALASFAPAGASAAKPEFHVEVWPAIVSGPQTEPIVITTSAGTIKCEVLVLIDSTFPEADSTLDTEADLGECNVFGLSPVEPTMNKCYFVFHLVPAKGGTATMDVDCPEGKSIEIPGKTCTVKIASQNNLGHVMFSNRVEEELVQGDFDLSEIEYTESANCNGNKTPQVTKNATLKGAVELKARIISPLGPQKFWIE